MNVLMVLSSCAQIPGTERQTGTWFEELAAPYYIFRAAGAQVTLASPAGGAAPIDPASLDDNFQSEATRRFSADTDAQAALANTRALSTIDTGVVPFLVEDELKRLGARYSNGLDWSSHVVVDGGLITGQNPASSAATAHKLLEALR